MGDSRTQDEGARVLGMQRYTSFWTWAHHRTHLCLICQSLLLWNPSALASMVKPQGALMLQCPWAQLKYMQSSPEVSFHSRTAG